MRAELAPPASVRGTRSFLKGAFPSNAIVGWWALVSTIGSGHYVDLSTTKLYSVDPQAWLTDVLARTADHKFIRIDELLP